jgi:VIT1/CCC1 family predicted Fe2+/Mn2+ transporter
MFAHAALKEYAFYIVWPTALALTDRREYGFDLNTENDLEELFVTLETLASRARRRVREQVRQKLESTTMADGESIAVAISGPPPQRRVASSTKFTLPLISRFFNARPNPPQQASDPE